MDNPRGAQVSLPSDRAIEIIRMFDAPREVVFEMWTKPQHVSNWWDPSGEPLAECEIDLRPGGAFRFVHRGARAHAFAGSYREIEPPARLVFTTPSPSGAASTGTLEFAAVGASTRLTMTIACASKADRDALLAMRVDAGTVRTLDNLAAYVAARRSGDRA
jgi:uncharacterized protein YndB with AHSA1/START domain